MEIAKNPSDWSEKQWIAFLLLSAIDADGKRHSREMRFLRVQVGEETVSQMIEFVEALPKEERAKILKESLPQSLKTEAVRSRVQKLLAKIFMADGNYGADEQAMTKQIGDWIRGEN